MRCANSCRCSHRAEGVGKIGIHALRRVRGASGRCRRVQDCNQEKAARVASASWAARALSRTHCLRCPPIQVGGVTGARYGIGFLRGAHVGREAAGYRLGNCGMLCGREEGGRVYRRAAKRLLAAHSLRDSFTRATAR
jgi:hypothetical protein